tara:strand:- start:106 stop:675 length:570 start_codon:yes stop_codon:yes gene_type:complete
MANIKISELTAASAVAGANELEINEAGTSKKITATQVATFVKADLLDDTTVNFAGTLQNGGSNVVVDTDIGSTVQAHDADTAVTDATQIFTASQRGTVTVDNDLSFDLNVTNNFNCTPTGGGTLTFTNHTAGQSGYVLLDNSGGHAITAAATTKINATDLATISVAGVYLVSYFDNGTNAYLTVSAAYV